MHFRNLDPTRPDPPNLPWLWPATQPDPTRPAGRPDPCLSLCQSDATSAIVKLSWACVHRGTALYQVSDVYPFYGPLQTPAVASVVRPWTRQTDIFEVSTFCARPGRVCSGTVKSSNSIIESIPEAAVSVTSVRKKFYDCSCQRRSSSAAVMAYWRLSRNDKFVIAMTTATMLSVTTHRSAHPPLQPHPRITRSSSSSSSTSVYRRRLAVVGA